MQDSVHTSVQTSLQDGLSNALNNVLIIYIHPLKCFLQLLTPNSSSDGSNKSGDISSDNSSSNGSNNSIDKSVDKSTYNSNALTKQDKTRLNKTKLIQVTSRIMFTLFSL